jgi:single-strand DNA-binding protein
MPALSINKAIIAGRLGGDPEVMEIGRGTKIVKFSVATTASWRDKASGDWKNKATWHRVAVYPPKLVEVCSKRLKKGSQIYIEGSIETRRWTDENGKQHYATEVAVKPFNGTIQILDGVAEPADALDDGDE